MTLWKPEKLEITPDDVIRGQGGNPEAIRNRQPRLLDIAAQAIEISIEILNPQVLYHEFDIKHFSNGTLTLENDATLKGALITERLAKADKVVLMIATVGTSIEEFSGKMMAEDPILGLAAEGVGGAAVEKIVNAVCTKFEAEAFDQGLTPTLPLSPGMDGWPVGEGQAQIFQAMPAGEIDVQLTPSGVILPKMSLSFALGIGEAVTLDQTPCEVCVLNQTCDYRSQYPTL